MKAAFRLAALALFAWSVSLAPAASPSPEWTGHGRYRALVSIDAMDTGGRPVDEGVAEIVVNWTAHLESLGIPDRVDLGSLQVIQYEPKSGRPRPYSNYGHARSPYDRPFRWYDGSIPYEFPEYMGYSSNIKDDSPPDRQMRVRGGYFYGTLGTWEKGHLAWVHTQRRGEASAYSIYFDLLPRGQEPELSPPRAWLGDGMQRCDERGDSTTGTDHTLIAVDDWDQDGLVDIVFGEDYGHFFWFPNRGSPTEPRFPFYRMISGSDGLPIDLGYGLSPLIVDWDGDGVKDLIAGSHWNRVVFFKNEGTDRDRKLAFRGFLKGDGKIFELPHAPIVGRSEAIFKEDYYPVLDAVDWDGDGDLDLLAGGYVTGRIYFYQNTGRGPDRLPILESRGPLEADGKTLNVGDWCAAPTAADFDGDGDLDVISGNFPMTKASGDSASSRFLQYYENTGTRTKPILTQRPFPSQGDFPRGSLATPRAVDWNGDGLLDLVVSARKNIYLYRNIGSPQKPLFQASTEALPSRWGAASIPGTGAYTSTQFIDWNRDGRLDAVSNYEVWLDAGLGNPRKYQAGPPVLSTAERIAHPSAHGDSWFFPRLYDLDRNGRLDVLFGDWGGNVWFHRNLSTRGRNRFDLAGYKLRLASGEEIKVGPIGKDPTKDFKALQGARTVFGAGDFNADGLTDLVVGDEYGIVRYFENVGTKETPLFSEPVEVGNLGSRLMVDAVDWNRDGRLDVLAGSSSGPVKVYLNEGTRRDPRFAAGTPLRVPPIIEPRTIAVDLNGDGDDDLFIPSTLGSCFVERSFLEHGYAPARLVKIEKHTLR